MHHMCRPSQTPHLTMSSAWIDPPKRVLGLKERVVTPPPIHGLPKEPFPVRPPADTRRSALATLAAQAARQQSTGSELDPASPALISQSFSRNLTASILPTSLAYIVPSTRGCP
ncbi:unnamed protein product, partial [Brassica rapa subsp. narinosa]